MAGPDDDRLSRQRLRAPPALHVSAPAILLNSHRPGHCVPFGLFLSLWLHLVAARKWTSAEILPLNPPFLLASFRSSTRPWMASNPISLKQRLAALSANMPGIRTDSPPSSPGWRRKSFFSPPVRSRTTDGELSRLGQEELESVMSRVIFQAGVDYESVACFIHV